MNKKMTGAELLKVRKQFERKRARSDVKLRKPYEKALRQFIKDNMPVKVGKVYELLENGIKRRGVKRLVIYDYRITWFSGHPTISVGLWWLDETSTPKKWDTFTVFGVSNPAKFKLSADQTNLPHPDKRKIRPEHESQD